MTEWISLLENDDHLGVKKLIKEGGDVNAHNEHEESVLAYAITYNHIPIVKRLIEEGIDVNSTQRKSGFTPLMGGVCYGRKEIVQLLLEHGAKVEASGSKGFTAADFARKMHNKSLLPLLES